MALLLSFAGLNYPSPSLSSPALPRGKAEDLAAVTIETVQRRSLSQREKQIGSLPHRDVGKIRSFHHELYPGDNHWQPTRRRRIQLKEDRLSFDLPFHLLHLNPSYPQILTTV
jgi:hypothetical protein